MILKYFDSQIKENTMFKFEICIVIFHVVTTVRPPLHLQTIAPF